MKRGRWLVAVLLAMLGALLYAVPSVACSTTQSVYDLCLEDLLGTSNTGSVFTGVATIIGGLVAAAVVYYVAQVALRAGMRWVRHFIAGR